MAFNFKTVISHFVYPPLCLHCKVLLPQRIPLLCTCCLEQISLIPQDERCPTCFSFLQKGYCNQCRHRPIVIRKQIAAVERMGSAATLLRSLIQGNRGAAGPLAALMAYQWLEYKMPLPDLVIPLPGFFWQKETPDWFLAQHIGKTFSIPVLSFLRKKWDKERFLTEGEFHVLFDVKKKGRDTLCDKNLLLIAATLDDDSLRSAAEALQHFFPQAVYGLAGVC